MLTVCSSSTSDQLTTPQELMRLLGTTATSCSAYWTDVDNAVSRASAAVETFVGYPLRAQVYQELVPAFGDRRLMLGRTPIRFVQRLFDSSDTGTATEYTSTGYRIDDAAAGFLSRDEGFVWTATTHYGMSPAVLPNSESRPWLVVYGAGYLARGTTTTCYGDGPTVPADLELAVLEVAKSYYAARSRDGDIQSKSVGDLSITYNAGMDAGDLPTSAVRMLRRWRRIV